MKTPTPRNGKAGVPEARRESITPEITRPRIVNSALDLLLVACVTALVVMVVGSVK